MAHQGYGFCEFLTEEDAEYACKIMNQIKLWGKPIRVNKVRFRFYMCFRYVWDECLVPVNLWVIFLPVLNRLPRIKNNWTLVRTCSLGTWMRTWMRDYYTTHLVLLVWWRRQPRWVGLRVICFPKRLKISYRLLVIPQVELQKAMVLSPTPILRLQMPLSSRWMVNSSWTKPSPCSMHSKRTVKVNATAQRLNVSWPLRLAKIMHFRWLQDLLLLPWALVLGHLFQVSKVPTKDNLLVSLHNPHLRLVLHHNRR